MAVSPWLIRRGQWSRIHILDYLDLEVLQHVGGSFAASCRLIPDPVEPPSRLSKLEARRAFDLPEDGRYIGCTGLMSSHKGIDLLVRAFREAQSKLRATDRLFLAGQMEPALRKVIESELAPEIAAQRFLLVDRPLTAQEVDDAVAALDVVCTPYPSHRHSASIVIRAAAAGKPVLGSAIGWMDHTIHRFSLGTTCNVRDTTTFARTIVETLDVAGEFHAKEAAKRFTAFHSISNFTSHFTARLRERLNLPSNALIDWDWVLESLR
jgi:glycosyltransferase involved in cell wall biosynthesis